MPIYEYACARCESEFEVEQRITEDPLKTCPRCRSRRIKRLISQTSFTLKGGGWYADGYSGSGDAKSNGSKPASPKPDGGSSSPGTSSSSAAGSGSSSPGGSGKSEAKGKKAVA